MVVNNKGKKKMLLVVFGLDTSKDIMSHQREHPKERETVGMTLLWVIVNRFSVAFPNPSNGSSTKQNSSARKRKTFFVLTQ